MKDLKKGDLGDQDTKVPRTIDRVVASVLCIILFIYCSVIFNVIIPYYGYSSGGVGHFLVLTVTTLLGTFSYLRCVFTDPGRVPKDWQPDLECPSPDSTNHFTSAVIQVKRSGAMRYCKKCGNIPKPPRTHHCRRCGHCVLRMDHHCVWINNCVGHKNYRSFFQMAFFLALAASHATLLILNLNFAIVHTALGFPFTWDAASDGDDYFTLHNNNDDINNNNSNTGGGGGSSTMHAWRALGWTTSNVFLWRSRAIFQLMATMLAIPLSLSLITLFVWNVKLLVQNKTTIEYHEGVAAKLSAAAASEGLVHPWDLGDWHDNVVSVFGDDMTWWVVPSCSMPGAHGPGTHFRTRWGW